MILTPNWWIDITLAVVQGLTEIFPVSSSAHLVVFANVFGRPMSFGRLLFFHLGTFFSILVWLRHDIWNIVTGRSGRQLPMFLCSAFIMTAIVGFLFKGLAEKTLADQVRVVPYLWLVNGLSVLMLGLFSPQGDRRIEQLRLQDFLLIGIIQGITAIPGISRLGFTLGIGLIIGLMWMDALKLSFLLSLPTILFANLYELVLQTGGFPLIKLLEAINGQGQWIPPLSSSNTFIGVLTFITSFVSGLFAVRILSSHLTRKLLGYFGLYCLSAGVFFILYYQLF